MSWLWICFPNNEKFSLYLFQPVICRFNSTRLDIDYDEPCDLPEYFECVEGKPARPGGSREGPDLDRGALFGGRPEVNRDFAAERPRRHAEVGSCRQVSSCLNNAVGLRH